MVVPSLMNVNRELDAAVTHEEVGAVQRAGAAANFDIVFDFVDFSQGQSHIAPLFEMFGDIDTATLARGLSYREILRECLLI